MLRRNLFILLVGLAVLVTKLTPALAARDAAIVMDADTGAVLFEEHADAPRYPASLTKVMTLYLLFEAIDAKRIGFETKLPVSAHAAGQDPTKLGLKDGETISVRDVILGLITKSANDAAVVAAEGLAGSEAKFARKMTEKARELGMAHTVFRNASGLPDRAQISTARDLAILARAMIRDFPHHYHFFATPSFTYKGIKHTNHNRLNNWYDGADGLKTGYIRASGFNLVTSAERDGRRLIGVVLGGKSPRARDREMARLLDAAFARDPSEPVIRHASAKSDHKVEAKASKPSRSSKSAKVARAQGSAEESDVWGVQVGAFSRTASARRATEQATKLAPTYLSDATVELMPHSTKKGRMYRARLIGMSESDARKACRALRKKRMGCVPLPPSEIRSTSSESAAASS